LIALIPVFIRRKKILLSDGQKTRKNRSIWGFGLAGPQPLAGEYFKEQDHPQDLSDALGIEAPEID
jgi:hypothetical protein